MDKDANGIPLLSVNAISLSLFGKNTKRQAVNDAIQVLGERLGEVHYVGMSPRFDDVQVGQIRQYLIDAGHISEEADVDEAALLTMNELAATISDELGLGRRIDPGTIHKTIELLDGRIAANHKKGVGKKRTAAYTSEEKDIIKQALWERIYKYSPIPDDRTSFSALSKEYNCVREIIDRAAAEVLSPDEIHSYTLSNNKIDQTVTEPQKLLIEAWLDREGYIWPEGYVTSIEAKNQFNTTSETVKRLAQKLLEDGELDSTDVRIRLNTKSGQLIRYSAHAMQVMEDSLKSNLRIQRSIARKADNIDRRSETVIPPDWLTNSGIAKAHDLDRVLVRNCAAYLHEQGTIRRIRDDMFTAGDSYYYPPDAVERIVATLANKPPEDWHSENAIFKAYGRRELTIALLKRHKDASKEYWYLGQPMRFYPPSVVQEMADEISEFPPEGWRTARMLRSHLGGSAKVWSRTIDYALANHLVSGTEYRSRKGSAMFYSAAEQETLVEARKQVLQQTGTTELGRTALK
jgi:hypothetical protein